MSATGSKRIGASRDGRALHAYHDGELKGWGRWRFERRLARCPELRRELEALARLRELVRESETEAPTPELWASIEQRLPAADARRAEAERAGGGLGAWLGWRLRPLGAAAAAAAAAALAFVLLSGDNPSAGVIRWMDSGERSVMVLEGDEEVTIIWVVGSAAGPPSRGGERGLA